MSELDAHRFGVSFLVFAISSCGGRPHDRGVGDTAVPVAPAVVARPSDTIAGAGRLQWASASIEEAVRKAGMTPVRAGSVRQPFLSGEGLLYNIGEAELQIYLYADARAVARDTKPLDTTRVAPPTMQVGWRVPPTLIVDNNMAAIFY